MSHKNDETPWGHDETPWGCARPITPEAIKRIS
jgi:hypothetical protein